MTELTTTSLFFQTVISLVRRGEGCKEFFIVLESETWNVECRSFFLKETLFVELQKVTYVSEIKKTHLEEYFVHRNVRIKYNDTYIAQ